MKFFIALLALTAFAVAEASPDLESRAGCSKKGQTCGGTFLCCKGAGDCIDQLVSLPSLFVGIISYEGI